MKKIHFSFALFCLFFVTSFGQQFKVSYPATVLDKPFTGNVIVYMSKDNKEPKDGNVGLEKFPCFSVYAKNIQPGESIIIDDNAMSYPTKLSDIERGDYYVQVVWDRNLGGRAISASPGNLYNQSEKINITKDPNKIFTILANKIISPVADFKETEFVKELKAPSSLLSNFLGKSMTVDAAVVLPKEYHTEPNKKFPIIFTVFGYGGDYHELSGSPSPSQNLEDVPVIMVYLDGNCSLGHSVYANSENNGPWGDALTNEFIPLLEKKYRSDGSRLLTGHSSGGWTVLWLQTQYPKVFAGCWSSSPDPVDFRSFQKINLYEDKNMFYDKNGAQNLIATVAGFIPWSTMKTFYQMESVVYRGEQMHSFDAVFSKKGTDGKPERICNNETGAINPVTFSHWKKYDISANLRNNWDSLKSDLDGKVRVTVGNQDNFLLNYAVKLLDTQMKELNSTFQFAYYPGDHFTLATPEFEKDGIHFLKQKYDEWLVKTPVEKN